jgi:hypothetical protein
MIATDMPAAGSDVGRIAEAQACIGDGLIAAVEARFPSRRDDRHR